jgi:hypothetical protein
MREWPREELCGGRLVLWFCFWPREGRCGWRLRVRVALWSGLKKEDEIAKGRKWQLRGIWFSGFKGRGADFCVKEIGKAKGGGASAPEIKKIRFRFFYGLGFSFFSKFDST